MELLYIWINKSKYDVFEDSQISLSEEFDIKLDKSEGTVKINIKKNEDYYNIFKSDVISNITALVGKNGSGKTTLLDFLYNKDISPENKVVNDDYKDLHKERYQQNKTLQVFKTEKFSEEKNVKEEVLKLVHNLDCEVKVDGETEVKCEIIKMNDDIFRESFEEENNVESITKIYLTNSFYTQNISSGYGSGKKINKAILSNSEVEILSYSFYEKLLNIKDERTFLDEMILKTRNFNNFQSVCDNLYFKKLLDEKLFDDFAFELQKKISIKINSVYSIKTKYENNINDVHEIIDKIENFNNKQKIKELEDIYDIKTNYIERLKHNLIYEILMKLKDRIDNIDLNILRNKDDSIRDFIDNLLLDKDKKEYYKSLNAEILEFEKILNENHHIGNRVPKNSDSYEFWYESNDKNTIKNFIDFIDKYARKEYSFVLRYIELKKIGLSSGERAFLNFFSWLSLIAFFNLINNKLIDSTKDNILLLIDEIDLYMHPEWQTRIIFDFISEIKRQFKDKNKKIQIIFATHSPIILSDMPKTNIVYMSKDEDKNEDKNKNIIVNRSTRRETFGANIYKLFNDSFFLSEKGLVGKFAKDKINEVYKTINKAKSSKDKLTDGELKKCKFIINQLGEDIIKRNLEKMLDLTDENIMKAIEKIEEAKSPDEKLDIIKKLMNKK